MAGDFWYDVAKSAIGFGFSLLGAAILFYGQRWYSRRDEESRARRSEQDDAKRRILQLVQGYAEQLPEESGSIEGLIRTSSFSAKLAIRLINYRLVVEDEEFEKLCELYPAYLQGVSLYLAHAPLQGVPLNPPELQQAFCHVANEVTLRLVNYIARGIPLDLSILERWREEYGVPPLRQIPTGASQ